MRALRTIATSGFQMRVSGKPLAADTAHVTPGIILRVLLACIVALLMLWLWRPSVVLAQSTSVGAAATTTAGDSAVQSSDSALYTVTVRSGEAIADIAKRLYGSSDRWNQLAAANGLTAPSGRYIVKVGTQLKVPGKSAADVAAAVRASRSASSSRGSATQTPSLAAQTAGKGNASTRSTSTNTRATSRAASSTKSAQSVQDSASRVVNAVESVKAATDERPIERSGVKVGIVSPEEMHLARGKDEPTIFMGKTAGSVEEARQAIAATIASRPSSTPRNAEYSAAPFAAQRDYFRGNGKIVRRVTAAGSADPSIPRTLTIADEAVIELPQGASAAVGDRFAAVSQGPSLGGSISVAIPSGVLEVVRSDAGKPVVARVVRQSGVIEEGQSIVTFSGEAAPATTQTTASADDALRGTVKFVQGDQLLTTIQTFLVIDATEAQGVRQGDLFWLVERIGTGSDARERRIAVLRIVRTSPFGSTGIITHQDRTGIEVGAAVRRVQKVVSGSAVGGL